MEEVITMTNKEFQQELLMFGIVCILIGISMGVEIIYILNKKN